MIHVSRPDIGEEEFGAVAEVLSSGKFISGRTVAAFEEEFAGHIGVRHAVAVNSGTAALHTILAAAGVGPGDEVIVPPLTFFATIESVLFQNALPVFADIEADTCCLDPADVKRRITEKTKAVLPVHLFGQAASMKELLDIGREYGIAVIEDCAQANGTRIGDRQVGSYGLAGAFSFFATKHMTTGEGGMITTNDDVLAERAKLIRSHGMSDRHTHIVLGHNYRMNEIAAAIGRVQLRKLPMMNERRIENSLHLIDRLSALDWLKPPVLRAGVEHTFFWAPFLVDEEKAGMKTEEVVSGLYEKGIEVRHRYTGPLYKQKIFQPGSGIGNSCVFGGCRAMDYSHVCLPNAERIAGRIIGLPNHPGLKQNELDEIVDVFLSLV